MDPARLRERLREVVKSTSQPTPVAGDIRRRADESAVEEALAGEWRGRDGGRSFVVARRTAATVRHGHWVVGDLALRLAGSSGTVALLSTTTPRPPFVFFDLETTGLSGGAGTVAFLVGCGWFDEQCGFVTEQHLLVEPDAERSMLQAVAERLDWAGALVSFNGKSFDAPVLDTRYSYHRLDPPCSALPHVDVLHPARRFWGVRDGANGPGATPCSLVVLERQVLGARRSDDVAGFDIPSRYFQFVRSGNVELLASILEHNRRDLLSLAALTARLLQMLESGPASARSAREALGLGRLYLRAGLDARAREALAHAIRMSRAPQGAFDPVRTEGLRALAIAWRRARQFDEAAECWRQLLDIRGCPSGLAREAREALAIHHEHRVRDLPRAKKFALDCLDGEGSRAWTESVRYRLARIERKLEAPAERAGACEHLPPRDAWLDLT